MNKPNTPTYKTLNWPSYNKALKRRGSLSIWFDPDMAWAAQPTGKPGRQPDYSDAAVQTCLTMKVLFGMALRQTTGFVEGLLCLIGLDWDVPDFSTLSRRQKTLSVNIPHRGSQGPLHLLIDSTGIKVEGEGEWNARKHGGPKRRVWRKIHLGIDEETLQIRAVEVTSSDVGDAPMLPELLDQISLPTRRSPASLPTEPTTRARATMPLPNEVLRQSSRRARTASHGRLTQQVPLRATKPSGRRNISVARSGDDGEGPARHRFEGGPERYHRRSRVETKMHCVKLLGQRLMARDFDHQVAEFQVRVAVLNGYTALGIPVTKVAG